MARKNQLVYKVAEAQSLGASFITAPTLIKYLDNVAYQIIQTGTPTGEFFVEASVDYAFDEVAQNVQNPGHWDALPLSTRLLLAGTPEDILVNLNQLPFTAIRVRYTRSSGTGTADIYLTARQIGG